MSPNRWLKEYEQKKTTPESAVQAVRSGDWIDFALGICAPHELEKALSQRKDELEDVKIRTILSLGPHYCLQADPEGKHFCWNSWHFSGLDRKWGRESGVYYIPMKFYELPQMILENPADVFMASVAPMDRHGWFNLGAANAGSWASIEKARQVVLEVCPHLPRALGGLHESIHISRVDSICDSSLEALPYTSPGMPSEEEMKIAAHIMEYIEDGACLQLGIGGIPNAVGILVAQSDLKDLGVHTEMYVDAFLEMYKKGRISGARKNINRLKQVFSFAFGSPELYDFMDDNPELASYPVNYTNDPRIIALNDRVISINAALEADLFGQIGSESIAARHISGTGGQLDFVEGAYHSRGGKSFVCLSSTVKLKNDMIESRIRPVMRPGTIITSPRTASHMVVTEYGIANLKGKSTWQRAEALIQIAHPDFRDDLIKEASNMKIWRKSNRLS